MSANDLSACEIARTLNAESYKLKNDNNEKGNDFYAINAAALCAGSWKHLCTWQTCHDNNYDRAFSMCKLDLLLVRNGNGNRRKRIAMKTKNFDLLAEISNILQPIKYTEKVCIGCGARIPEYLDKFELCAECQLKEIYSTKQK